MRKGIDLPPTAFGGKLPPQGAFSAPNITLHHISLPSFGRRLSRERKSRNERLYLYQGPGSQPALRTGQLTAGPARLEVFALTGQRVALLHQGAGEAGVHRVFFDGRDDRGRPLASGVYLYRLVTDQTVQTRKLTLLQ